MVLCESFVVAGYVGVLCCTVCVLLYKKKMFIAGCVEVLCVMFVYWCSVQVR